MFGSPETCQFNVATSFMDRAVKLPLTQLRIMSPEGTGLGTRMFRQDVIISIENDSRRTHDLMYTYMKVDLVDIQAVMKRRSDLHTWFVGRYPNRTSPSLPGINNMFIINSEISSINSKTLAVDIDQGGKAVLSSLRKLYVSVPDSYGWLMVPLGAVLFVILSWEIIYNDSVVPGVHPPSPFASPAKLSRNRTGLARYWNLNYTMPVLALIPGTHFIHLVLLPLNGAKATLYQAEAMKPGEYQI
uniref:Uncharacterized protein n=1 Tax=Timema genevievae TaxID=629358 RepID=A0A7R9JWK1_TIMGE|nr:unnamed protein product [Timema genevievae]